MTEAEYLAFEHASAVKHEFVDGEVYGMTGTTLRHNAIALNVAMRLRALGRPHECRAFALDVKVRVSDDRYYYPDVVVTCSPVGADDLTIHAPCLIVEVTSPSTESTDRREKAPAYRTIPGLGAYLIVDHRQRRVTRHWRDDGEWRSEDLSGEGAVPLPCPPGAELTLDEIYEDV
jgi:Uma2 family endonuclease